MPVKIHGNDYVTVAERVAEFHKIYKDQTKSIITEIIQFKDGIVVVKAVVKVGEEVYVGHAYEDIGSSPIMETSSLEVCETSALGRAMGFLNIGLDVSKEIASAEEIITAKLQQNAPSKPEKVDLTNDDWRDLLIGYKAEKKKDLTWKTAEDEDLIWITESGPEKWKPLAKEELNFRNQDRVTATQEGIKKDSVTKEQVDSEFA